VGVRRIAARAAAVLLSTLLTLLVLEGAVRVFVPPAHWRYHDASQDWRPDPELGWVQKGNLDMTTRAEAGWLVRFRTNADGVTPAGARREREQGVLRIMIFGDSTVVGRGVPQDRAVHAALERLLARGGRRVEVINAGVEGYSTDQVLLRMRRLLPLYRPAVVLYGLCDNDFGGNVDSVAFGVPKPRFALEGGRLTYVPPAGVAGDIEEFVTGPRRWLQGSALYRLVRPRIIVLRARLGNWEERNLIGLAPDFYYDPARLAAVDWRLFSVLLREMDATARRSGARLLFYSHPALAEVWDPFIRDTQRRLGLPPGRYDRYALERRLREVSAATAVPYCPLIDAFLVRRGSGPFHLLPRDPHCNPTGYQVTAETLARCLQSNSFLSSSSRSSRATTAWPSGL
jgi:lysophospholipase L1-like esterase